MIELTFFLDRVIILAAAVAVLMEKKALVQNDM